MMRQFEMHHKNGGFLQIQSLPNFHYAAANLIPLETGALPAPGTAPYARYPAAMVCCTFPTAGLDNFHYLHSWGIDL